MIDILLLMIKEVIRNLDHFDYYNFLSNSTFWVFCRNTKFNYIQLKVIEENLLNMIYAKSMLHVIFCNLKISIFLLVKSKSRKLHVDSKFCVLNSN